MKVNFFTAQLLLWKRIFDYKGKSSPKEYWYPAIVQIVLCVLGAFNLLLSTILLKFAVFNIAFAVIGVLFLVYPTLAIIPSIALTVRRLRDAGKSGWWTMLLLFVGVGTIIVLYLCAGASTVSGAMFRNIFDPFYNEAPAVYGPPEWFDPDNNINNDVYGPPDWFDPSDNEEPAVYGPPDWLDD